MHISNVRCKNGLPRENFLELDFLDFATAVLLRVVDVGILHAIHDGLDCATFSIMQLEKSHREESNSYMGTSAESY